MNLLDFFLKLITIYLCVVYSYFKLLNKQTYNNSTKIVALSSAFIIALFQSFILDYTPFILRIFIVYFSLSIILGKLSKSSLANSIVLTIISLSLTYITNFVSLFFIVLIEKVNLFHTRLSDTVTLVLASFVNMFIIYLFFKIRRFKSGFPFLVKKLDNTYFDIFVLVINSIIIMMYFSIENFYNTSMIYISICFAFFVIIMFIIVQKTFILYQKQKLQLQALKDYEQELSETKQKLETAIQEKDKIVKSNHEFYHRQEALNKKLDTLLQQQAISISTEFSEEYSNILDRLNTLSNEYSTKTASTPILDKTNIPEIDDMLTYMQSECTENHIEFILKIDCDVHYMITNFISKSQLETLLGDLIRNAIIAINHSSDSYKSIMVVFGIKDDSYELCVLDSGIPFEVDTLINLGLKPSSTHLDDGGTGIGFMTTFETINSCNASFIINEITNNNYTKSLEIKFDNKNEYVIISDRKDKIEEMKHSDREIILR